MCHIGFPSIFALEAKKAADINGRQTQRPHLVCKVSVVDVLGAAAFQTLFCAEDGDSLRSWARGSQPISRQSFHL